MGTASDLRLYRRLLFQARPYWAHLLGIFVLSLLSTPLTLLTPLPLKIVVDHALGSAPLEGTLAATLPASFAASPSGALVLAISLLFLTTLLTHLRGLASGVLEAYTGERLVRGFRAQLFDRVQRLSLSYHDRKGATDSLYRIQYDAPAIQWVAVQGVIPFASALLTVAGMAYVMARIDAQLALVAALAAPVLFATTQIFRRRIRREWTRVKELESSTMSGVQETLSSLRVVKAFGQELRENDRFLRSSGQSLRGQLRLAVMNGGFDAVIGLTIAVSSAAVLYIGVRHIQTGQLTLGNLLLVMAYLGQLYTPLRAISRKIADLQAALASAERVYAILDQEPEVAEMREPRALVRSSGAIALHNVCFAYPGGQQVLHDVSIEVAPGDRVGIMGRTGAGKTTLLSLMMRFYDPTSGNITIDGVDIRGIRLADLRRQCAVVLQEPVLFSTSIAENIAYARWSATEEEIRAAARLAHADEFVSRLPQGYLTQVGERGMALSGGERQRVALARAFLKDAPILILDEPTSSVDVRTEAAIVEAIEKLMRGRTTFMISHRRGALRHCTVEIVLDGGRIIADAAGTAAPPARTANLVYSDGADA